MSFQTDVEAGSSRLRVFPFWTALIDEPILYLILVFFLDYIYVFYDGP